MKNKQVLERTRTWALFVVFAQSVWPEAAKGISTSLDWGHPETASDTAISDRAASSIAADGPGLEILAAAAATIAVSAVGCIR